MQPASAARRRTSSSRVSSYELNANGDPRDDDSDGDGAANYVDADDDSDGLLTKNEAADANGDGDPADARNSDLDLLPDYLDADDDGDGVPTAAEHADLNEDGSPADAQDTDLDGTLYQQSSLRRAMALMLLRGHALRPLTGWRMLKVLGAYRRAPFGATNGSAL